jgi:hypothetical protein
MAACSEAWTAAPGVDPALTAAIADSRATIANIVSPAYVARSPALPAPARTQGQQLAHIIYIYSLLGAGSVT